MEMDEDREEEQRRRPKQIPARYLRGPPIKTQTEDMEVDVDREQRRKPKQIPAKYLRGPPISKAQAEGASPRDRAARLSSQVFHSHHEDDDDGEDEEQGRPKAIAACHLRGLPTRPRDRDTQSTVRTPESRPRRRWEPAAQTILKNSLHRDDRCWREHFEADKEFIGEDCGSKDARVTGSGPRLWWVCAGLCFLIALATFSF